MTGRAVRFRGAGTMLALALLLSGFGPDLSGFGPAAGAGDDRQSRFTEMVLGLGDPGLGLGDPGLGVGEPRPAAPPRLLAADRSEGGAVSVRPRARWQWPLAGEPRVVKTFDPPDQPWLPGHRGIDLAGIGTEPVLAVADGTVTYSGSIAGIGIVSITHADGIRSTYQPVSDRVSSGDTVGAGDQIGVLGSFGSHCLLRTCLHLGAVRGKRDYLDPLFLLQPWELTLLPHSGE